MKYLYSEKNVTTTPLTIDYEKAFNIANAWENRITIEKNVGAGGTLTIEIKMKGTDSFQSLKVDGAAVEVNLSSIAEPQTFAFKGDIEAWKITATGLTGSYDVVVAGE